MQTDNDNSHIPSTEEDKIGNINQFILPDGVPAAACSVPSVKATRKRVLTKDEMNLQNLGKNQSLARLLVGVSVGVLIALNIVVFAYWMLNPDSQIFPSVFEKAFVPLQSIMFTLLGYLFGKNDKSE